MTPISSPTFFVCLFTMDHQNTNIPMLGCPICPFTDSDENFIIEHVEYCHPDHSGVTNSTALYDNVEASAPKDMSSHTGLLPDQTARIQDPGPSGEHRSKGSAKGLPHSSINNNSDKNAALKNTPSGSVKRLRRSELGPYANEKQMPSWLRKLLEKGAKRTRSNRIAPDGTLHKHESVENETPGIVPVLARLCKQDKSVGCAFLCNPNVYHVSKMSMEGSFCGYRNIQMLISYIKECHCPGHDHFPGPLPTILQLQDMIERAWDLGFNSVGRLETGGIRGTRKFIGTPEAQALFSSLGIRCEASSIGDTKETRAHDALLETIAAYFRGSHPIETDDKVIVTSLPPVYLQHHGHSLTIVGFEIRDSGKANLLVFDPMFKTSRAMKRLKTTSAKVVDPTRILKGYRRGAKYLQRYKAFEILKMRTSPNVIITGTPGVGKTVHCEQIAQDTGLRHLSINQVAKDRGCFESYDEELETWVVDEDKLLDAIEEEVLQGGYLIDWHACDLFPKSWIDLVVVLRCPSTSILYDRLSTRGYKQEKLQENMDAEIFGVLVEEAREAYDEEIVVELNSEKDDDVDNNCARISSWVERWKIDQTQ
ncbi:DUF1671-domain-containing protein [Aspergillus campestris IBT 28561]|uniref:Adenylate kinase isoenzyme 6 homolog n=1 Tax=Aspergillus campestris (strain IBT 28561) TaxID=1392248 RepID=A0A2I1D655_ASPC2|nr:DUF1671-domain-containing protein [Aspergillus campestris IBT 28561]PKY05357.1 DUF1671-domain-containing protein [Aspergillus campestris IBT 28561]